MSFLNFRKNNNSNHVVWRDSKGNISCPGNSCPKDCDNSCPIYLNTQGLLYMKVNKAPLAIPLYKEALNIAPDFYDAWNNLGGGYGQMGLFQEAYDCYKKACELNPKKPNPVYGLMIACRDLGKYEECLSLCDKYSSLSGDGLEKTVREQVNKRLRNISQSESREKQVSSEDKNIKKQKLEVVKISEDKKYLLLNYEKKYYFANNENNELKYVCTPSGEKLNTEYLVLAERLFEDIQKYDIKYFMSEESLLPWQFTLCDNFIKMQHKELVELLISCFIKKNDWTYECQAGNSWHFLFGNKDEREEMICKWLTKCTHMQMTAICCIGNAFESINVAFVIAYIIEKYTKKDKNLLFEQISKLIDKNSDFGPDTNIVKVFNNFDFYYGIHLAENGPIINDISLVNDEKENKRNTEKFTITEDILVGRNYYHYINGKKDKKQTLLLNHDLAPYLSKDDELLVDELEYPNDKYDTDDELVNHIPNDCWLKKIRINQEDNESYYLITLEVKNGEIVKIKGLIDEVSRFGNGMLFIPKNDMQKKHSYEEINIDDNLIIKKEIDSLKKCRFIAKDFSFLGKKLPKEIIEEHKLNNEEAKYNVLLQSAYRLAYMNLFVYTEENGIITDFDYFTYQSTGSIFGDMFTRPVDLDNKNEEALDMLLYIIDKYTDEEYATL